MQDYFDREVFKGSVDSTQLSFVGTIGFAFCGLMGPVTPFFMSLVGARWVLFFGTVLISAGLILASFSTQVWQLYITQSVMHGMGAALLYIVIIKLMTYFFLFLYQQQYTRFQCQYHHNGLLKEEGLLWALWSAVQVSVG